ncbi:unnamed protein product, partial [Rotaria socialis]
MGVVYRALPFQDVSSNWKFTEGIVAKSGYNLIPQISLGIFTNFKDNKRLPSPNLNALELGKTTTFFLSSPSNESSGVL